MGVCARLPRAAPKCAAAVSGSRAAMGVACSAKSWYGDPRGYALLLTEAGRKFGVRKTLPRVLVLGCSLVLLTSCEKRKDTAGSSADLPVESVSVAAAISATPSAISSAGLSPPAPPAEASAGSAEAAPAVTGTLATRPDPVPICPKTGLGRATIVWTVNPDAPIEVRVGTPDGALFAASNNSGSQKTGLWVTADSVFFLQSTANNAARSLEHTLARLAVKTVNGPCP